jgi:hypothetical protein
MKQKPFTLQNSRIEISFKEDVIVINLLEPKTPPNPVSIPKFSSQGELNSVQTRVNRTDPCSLLEQTTTKTRLCWEVLRKVPVEESSLVNEELMGLIKDLRSEI